MKTGELTRRDLLARASAVIAGLALGQAASGAAKPRSAVPAVAAGTISRNATQSHSLARPSKGRGTCAIDSRLRALPWHALYRLPEPHGQGSRWPTTGMSSVTR